MWDDARYALNLSEPPEALVAYAKLPSPALKFL
jgi:hypothetical protein